MVRFIDLMKKAKWETQLVFPVHDLLSGAKMLEELGRSITAESHQIAGQSGWLADKDRCGIMLYGHRELCICCLIIHGDDDNHVSSYERLFDEH